MFSWLVSSLEIIKRIEAKRKLKTQKQTKIQQIKQKKTTTKTYVVFLQVNSEMPEMKPVLVQKYQKFILFRKIRIHSSLPMWKRVYWVLIWLFMIKMTSRFMSCTYIYIYIYIYIYKLSRLEYPANTYLQHSEHWKAVSNFWGLISSANRHLQLWRSNQNYRLQKS